MQDREYVGQTLGGKISGNAAYQQLVDAPQPASPLDMVGVRLSEVLNFVVHQGERLEGISNKLVGSGPCEAQAKTAGRPVAVPCGTIAQMNDTLDSIMSRLNQNDDIVSRLRGAI